MLRALITALLFFIACPAFTQSNKLSGRILNDKNEPLAAVSIKILGATGGTTTDIDGGFSLNLHPGKKYELEISAIGYETKIINDVELVKGDNNELNIVLEIKATTGQNVVLTSSKLSARRESVAAIIAFQKNTNTVASVISAESIRRSPDKNTGEVLKRTPGASIQEGRFIIVRGLADRYNQAMLNGILLTGTEPDRKTFSFDLIPSSMIDNIVINKAFVPEYPGEWAGGLIQVNTKDIPARNFLNFQIGTGFNSGTIGKYFYREKAGGLDWLGVDDGSRALPKSYTKKYEFDLLSAEQKTAIGKQMPDRWVAEKTSSPLNVSFQANGGFITNVFRKKLGGTFGIIYSKSNSGQSIINRLNKFAISGPEYSSEFSFNDKRYQQDIAAGALGIITVQLSPANKISIKSVLNVNTSNAVTQREGLDNSRTDTYVQGTEFNFRQNIFFTVQISGEHNISSPLKLKWYGAFNILDGYIPDQRRILYTKADAEDPYRLLISNTLSQQSGSRIYQSLSDYIYTAGGDLAYNFGKNQSAKAGYMLQVKDRLYDAKLFAIYLPVDNDSLRLLPASEVFDPANFGNGTGNKFGFDAIKGRNYRYMANTILNSAFLQFDNQIGRQLRIVWGMRVENFDQLVGSVKTWDPRHNHSIVTDYLPGINATYKLDTKTNLRLSGSQTVIRPELRELSFLNIYDFELNASVQGNPDLKRTKVTNLDLRYELYPATAETFSVGIFYKNFDNPIEQLFNGGGGGASSFNFRNAKKASSFGTEIELRKKLDFIAAFKNFIFQGNISFIKSKVEDAGLKVDRPLQGQSPYVINVGLLYDQQKTGFTATVLYNQIGHRLAYVGNADDGFRDTYEAARPVLDLQFSKKFLLNKAELRLNISDLLSQTRYFYQNPTEKTGFDKNRDAYRFTRKTGSGFSINFNYSL